MDGREEASKTDQAGGLLVEQQLCSSMPIDSDLRQPHVVSIIAQSVSAALALCIGAHHKAGEYGSRSEERVLHVQHDV